MSGQVAAWKQITVALALVALAAAGWLKQDSLAAWLGFAAGTERTATPERTGVPVIVAPVRMARDALVLEAVGTGLAQHSVMLQIETAGKIAAMPMQAGQRYKAGEVLLRLEDTAQRLAVELATARLDEARRVRDRMRRLAKSGTITEARLEETETAAAIARIELQQAREHLADRVLRAPFDGVAGLSEVEVGDRITPETEIAGFDDRSVILVGFDLPEALLGRVRLGMAVTATTPAVPGRRFDGSMRAIDSRVTSTSRTIRVRVAIPNPADLLRPGGSFTITLELPGDRYPAVPELALQFTRGALYVWRVEDGKAERVEVRLIRRRGGNVLIAGPIDADDRIVVEGTQRLSPGSEVAIVETGEGQAT